MTKRPAWNHNGRSRHERGYGRQHVKLRDLLLQQEPLCRLCKQKRPPRYTPATIADHVISLAKGGAAHSLENLQPLCLRCHQKKTLVEQGKRYKPTIALEGWPTDD